MMSYIYMRESPRLDISKILGEMAVVFRYPRLTDGFGAIFESTADLA